MPEERQSRDHAPDRPQVPSRGVAAALSAQFLLGTLLILLPSFEHVGHIHSLAAALLFATVPGALLALGLARHEVPDLLRRLPGLWVGFTAVALVPPALAEIFGGDCGDPIGILDFLLNTGVGLGLGVVLSASLSRARTRGRILGAWIGVQLVLLVLAAAPFYLGPGVSAYHLIGGYFPGSIYDRIYRIPEGFLWHRLLVLCIAYGLVQALRARAGLVTRRAAVLAFAPALLLELGAAPLGFRVDRDSLEAVLPGQLTHRGMELRFDPRRIEGRVLEDIWDDARFRYDEVSELLDAADLKARAESAEAQAGLGDAPRRARIYLFSDGEARWQAVGVRRVALTKPWRREAYLSAKRWDDCTFKHELLHVLLADYTDAPFGVPSDGWASLPNMGMTEGLAEGLTACPRRFPVDWKAAVMLREDKLPLPADLASAARFWTLPGRRAYAAAASFFAWLVEHRGLPAVLSAYGDGRLDTLVSGSRPGPFESIGAMSDAWRAHLGQLRLSDEEEAWLTEVLSKRSVFQERCAVERARKQAEIGDAVRGGRWRAALAGLDELDLLGLSGPRTGRKMRVGLRVRALVREGRREEAVAELDEALERSQTFPKIFWLRLARADLDYLGERFVVARAAYVALLDVVKDETLRRQVQVRLMALTPPYLPPEEMGSLLFFPDLEGVQDAAMKALVEGLPGDARVQYLWARRRLGQRRYGEALEILTAASLAPGALLGQLEIMRELKRMIGIAAYRAGDLDRAESAWNANRVEALTEWQRALPEEWLRRIRLRTSR